MSNRIQLFVLEHPLQKQVKTSSHSSALLDLNTLIGTERHHQEGKPVEETGLWYRFNFDDLLHSSSAE